MSLSKHVKKMSVLLCAGLILSGCGGGDGGFSPADAANDGTQGISGPPHSVIISYPLSNAIEDQENGVYMRKASILVADQQGRPVADGTRVTMRLIDSIIVEGEVTDGNPDQISSSNLSIPSAVQTDGTPVPDLTTVTINRPGVLNGQNRGIQAGDTVLLFNNSFNSDVLRSASSRPELANTLSVNAPYNSDYPDYDNAAYMVGASMLGGAISGANFVGETEDGALTPGEVRVSGGNGTATVWIRYPIQPNYIAAGCNPDIDDRISPVGSGQVYLVATTGTVSGFERFCFSPIAGFEVISDFTTLSVGSGTASTRICVRDGGDRVFVPFSRIQYNQTGGPGSSTANLSNTASLGGDYTNAHGCFTANFEAATGISEWTFVVGDGSVSVEIIGG